MTMGWWTYFVLAGLLSGIVSWLLVRNVRRYVALISCSLPFACFLLLFFVALEVGLREATCDAPDCGPLLFVASGLFALMISSGGLIGSILGVLFAYASRKRHSDR